MWSPTLEALPLLLNCLYYSYERGESGNFIREARVLADWKVERFFNASSFIFLIVLYRLYLYFIISLFHNESSLFFYVVNTGPKGLTPLS